MDRRDGYELILGSDLDQDGMFLEARRQGSGELALFAFDSDADGSLSFERYLDDLPAELVNDFRAEAARRLPPAGDSAAGQVHPT